jgi:hypothetical protein
MESLKYYSIPILLALLLLLILGFMYTDFSKYTPESQERVETTPYQTPEVSGIIIPYPVNSEKISDNKSLEGRQITLSTTQSQEEIHKFYRNVFLSDEWELESEGAKDSFYITEYKTKDNIIIVTTSQLEEDENTTIVSVEIKER